MDQTFCLLSNKITLQISVLGDPARAGPTEILIRDPANDLVMFAARSVTVPSLLAVHMDKLRCRISIASRSVCRHCMGKRGNFFRRERHIESTESLGEPIAPARTNQWDDVFALRGCAQRHPQTLRPLLPAR
jgi:hypothetical protein